MVKVRTKVNDYKNMYEEILSEQGLKLRTLRSDIAKERKEKSKYKKRVRKALEYCNKFKECTPRLAELESILKEDN